MYINLIKVKKSFVNDKHVDCHLVEKQTQKICRRIFYNKFVTSIRVVV